MPFEIFPYSTQQLIDLLAKVAKTSPVEVANKQHISYFDAYFGQLQAATIVAEFDYIDHDYLEDYSNYYVKCFHDYDRKCARLHFFQATFTKEALFGILAGEDCCQLKDGYLGFIVVKPLPKTIIGRTCLKTYSSESRRAYPIAREYVANLFGLDLKVVTLAYQEQDSVAAACATSALWSVFHGTGVLFHHPIPSPIEITKAALEKAPAEQRNLPNKGLTLEQLGHAIREVDLDPFMVRATNEYVLKSTAYGYLRAGIPIYFSIRLFDGPEFLGGHGVALGGYSIDGKGPIPMPGSGFLLRASRIEKFYVHDDQVGPFARMGFDNGVVTTLDANNKPITLPSMNSSWRGGNGRAVPNAILIPLYHKIRIPYEVVHDMVFALDAQLEIYRASVAPLLPQRLEWDIFLSRVNVLKSEILKSPHLAPTLRPNVLTTKLPKYVWRAIGYLGDAPVIEFLFDATDIEQGNIFISAIPYDINIFNLMVMLSKLPHVAANARQAAPIVSWLSSQITL